MELQELDLPLHTGVEAQHPNWCLQRWQQQHTACQLEAELLEGNRRHWCETEDRSSTINAPPSPQARLTLTFATVGLKALKSSAVIVQLSSYQATVHVIDQHFPRQGLRAL